MLLHGTCEAQLRRMLHIGVVTQLYDEHVFPTPDHLKSQYEVTDERTGRLIRVPHPVSGLRVWRASHLHYETIDPHLSGAPSESSREAWWANQVAELKEQMGAEYIESLLAGRRG